MGRRTARHGAGHTSDHPAGGVMTSTIPTQRSSQPQRPVDEALLEELAGRIIGDVGATISAGLVWLGDRLGLYRALAEQPATAAELAARTGTTEVYLRPWLANQAASGYVDHDPDSERFSLSPEQAMAFADEEGPAFFVGAFQVALAALHDARGFEQRFRSGDGFGWHEHDADLFEGTARFFRPG